jgi:HD-GYP domain-containing protein (c-di-GMP phosphodiesterase class II)
MESLLADLPEHDEAEYDLGEVTNMVIQRGTLNDDERRKINDHIVLTIDMLKEMPFPKHLKMVPEYAGGHHEKMDGTGYPNKLTGDQMSWPAKMMAVADIFEALTAADRPYKKAKTLSESLKILFFMKKDKHIDADLFELFLRSGAYLEYAEQFLRPEQIDKVDINNYLMPPPPRQAAE